MIRATVKTFEAFPQITAAVETKAVEGLNEAARDAAAAAQANASINLELDVIPAAPTVDGFSAGIRSRRTSSHGRSTPIARFFDQGTLGERTKPTKRPRRSSWQVQRGGGSYTAERGTVEGKGIRAERFFAKARTVGRARLLARIFG